MLTSVINFLIPPLCVSCDAPVGEAHALCAACWGKMRFIAPPFCAACGIPFDVPIGDGALCGDCLRETPHFASARAALVYDEHSRGMLLAFKRADRTHLAPALANWMHRAGAAFWPQADFIVPVPLHPWRLFWRRYNQSAILAQRLAALSGVPALVDALQRRRATPSQGRLSRAQRFTNVKGAFRATPGAARRIRDKTIILIDDVMTTGATAEECSRALLKAGAKAVHVLAAARVPAAL